MPKPRRNPIDYTPQFGGGIFRPTDVVVDELAAIEDEDEVTALDEPPPPAQERTNEQTNDRSHERVDDRARVRHSFDVWRDQLQALAEIQAQRFVRTRRKPKLGELVQEALDAYIARQKEQLSVRTNERTNGTER